MITQRGKAKQKRTDLRLVGLGLVIQGTQDSDIPLLAQAYRGNKPPTDIETACYAETQTQAAA